MIGNYITNGKMARILGIDPKTLRKWAKRGLVPSYINNVNNYRYYFKNEVIRALKGLGLTDKK
ncbi:MAG: MerR family DNA-binding transcriptional regulator [candidate division Zixibacteria bacterium]|nr:MerR family DNA-binding transcriptional regulator [candidate division Zixibacteria bacterium]